MNPELWLPERPPLSGRGCIGLVERFAKEEEIERSNYKVSVDSKVATPPSAESEVLGFFLAATTAECAVPQPACGVGATLICISSPRSLGMMSHAAIYARNPTPVVMATASHNTRIRMTSTSR